MKRVGFITFFIFFISLCINAQKVYLQFNQMLGLELGMEYSLTEDMGVKGSIGTSIFSIKTVIYSFNYYYKLPVKFDNIGFYLDIGFPICYFDLWEDKYVDWDKYIDSPYAGWLIGPTLRTVFFEEFMLNTGVSYWIEWQEDDGFKNGIIPIVSIAYRLPL